MVDVVRARVVGSVGGKVDAPDGATDGAGPVAPCEPFFWVFLFREAAAAKLVAAARAAIANGENFMVVVVGYVYSWFMVYNDQRELRHYLIVINQRPLLAKNSQERTLHFICSP